MNLYRNASTLQKYWSVVQLRPLSLLSSCAYEQKAERRANQEGEPLYVRNMVRKPGQINREGVVSRSAEQKQKVYYPRVSAEAEDVRYTIRGFGVLIKNDFEV